MTRGQWITLMAIGVIAVVAFNRTEEIAQRVGMATVIRKPAPASGMV